ncbi:hypothetical protein [Paenibacillus periandrae]|uniref:hypothetical protein n=1 Tax=Paenibacillus periandrae TaxID=1761741 RepID=UPI001F08CA6D|nr:hypothetical protein [Paenibacillus periandrae]
MKLVNKSEIPALLAQKIQPIVIQDTPEWDRFLEEFAPLAAEVEQRKERAKEQAG